MQLTESGYVINNQNITFTGLRSKLAKFPGANVYCEIEKFTQIPDQQFEELASIVIQSGGRFFYRQIAGAIYSAFWCTEIVKN